MALSDDPSACLEASSIPQQAIGDSLRTWRDSTLANAKQTGDFQPLLQPDSTIVTIDRGDADSQWISTPNGRVWCHRINTPTYNGSTLTGSMALKFDNFDLASVNNAEMIVYDEDGNAVLGPYTDADNDAYGFTTATVPFEGTSRTALIVAYYESTSGVQGASSFNIQEAVHGFAGIPLNESGTFTINASTDPSCERTRHWANEIRSSAQVVSMNYAGGRAAFPTATVLNSTDEDLTPYLLFSEHTWRFSEGTVVDGGDPNAGNIEILRFRYRSDRCGETRAASDPDIVAMAPKYQILATSGRDFSEDFTLAKLQSPIPREAKVYYAGWSIDGVKPESTAVSGFPKGDVQKLAFGSDVEDLQDTWYMQFDKGNDGGVQAKSSGSAVYDEDHRLVGHIATGSVGENGSANAPKFSLNWDRGISDHLDASGTGQTEVAPIANHDLTVNGFTFTDPDTDYATAFFRTAGRIDVSNTTVESTGRLVAKARETVHVQAPFHAKSGSRMHLKGESGPTLDDLGIPSTGGSSSKTLAVRGGEESTSSSGEKEDPTAKAAGAAAFEGPYDVKGAYPNPFASETQIDLRVKERQDVSVVLYDVMGREVSVIHRGPVPRLQVNTFRLSGSRLASGVYLVRISGESFSTLRKVVRVR